MPKSIVRSKEDEAKWKRAKAAAVKQGQAGNYALIMHIYKKMKGGSLGKSLGPVDDLNKGTALPVGTVRQWKGGSYRKTGAGTWEPAGEGEKASGRGRPSRRMHPEAAKRAWARSTYAGEAEIAKKHGFDVQHRVNEASAMLGLPAKHLHVQIPFEDHSRVGAIQLRCPPGKCPHESAVIHRHPSEKGKWQLSRFDAKNNAIGHSVHDTPQVALDHIRKDGFHVDNASIQPPGGQPQADIEVDKGKILKGNLGIPRIQMPQIPAPLVPAFIKQLKAKGVSSRKRAIPVGELRATQSEIHAPKVKKMAAMGAPFFQDPDKTILVSKDGFVLDGHHRWAALKALDPANKIHTIQIDLPIRQLLDESHKYEGTEYAKAWVRMQLDLIKATAGGLQPVHVTQVQPAWKRIPGAASMLRNRRERLRAARGPEQRYLDQLYTGAGMPTPKPMTSDGGPYLAGQDVVRGLGLTAGTELELAGSIDRMVRSSQTDLSLRKAMSAWRFDHPDLDPSLRSELGRRTLALFREKRRQQGDFIVKSNHPLILSLDLLKAGGAPFGGGNRQSQRGQPARPQMPAEEQRKAIGRPGGNKAGPPAPKAAPPREPMPGADGQPPQDPNKTHPDEAVLDTHTLEENGSHPDHLKSKLRQLHKELHTLHEHIETEGQIHMHNDIVDKMRDAHANPTPEALEAINHMMHHFSEMLQGPEMDESEAGPPDKPPPGGGGDAGPLAPPKGGNGAPPSSKRDEARKALVLNLDLVKGAALPVGTHREWSGQEYVKVGPGKWEPAPGAQRGAKPQPGAGDQPHPDHGQVFTGQHDEVIHHSDIKQDRQSPDDAVQRSIGKMKESIASGKGKRQPLEVHKVNQEDGGHHYRLRDGNTTFQALKQHGWESFPVKVTKEVHEKDYKPTGEHKRETPAEKKAKIEKAAEEAAKLEHELKKGHDMVAAARAPSARDKKLKKLAGKEAEDYKKGWERMNSLSAEEHEHIAREVQTKHDKALQRGLFELRDIAGDKATVDGRVKTLGSIVGKIGRQSNFGDATNIHDITGMRVVHDTVDEVRATVDKLKKKYKVTFLGDNTDNPRPGGYRSAHVIIKDKDGLTKEIQVRTNNQHTWAEWCHDVYKPPTPALERVVKENNAEISDYAATLSEHFYSKDKGDKPPDPPKPDCPPIIQSAFGCPS